MEATIGYVAVAGASLWTTCQGSGPAVVLCHGGPGLWDYLAPVAALIDDLATVYRYDQRACGRSTGGPPYDVATAVADLDALRAHWGLADWIVAGHSWGATLALAYCLRHPARARGLIYLSGTGIDPAWHADYKANQAARLGQEGQRRLAELKTRLARAKGAEWAALDREYCALSWATDFADQSRARDLARRLFVADLHPNYEVNRLLWADARRVVETDTFTARLPGLRMPTLIIHGEADPRPLWAARRLAGLIPGAQLQTIPDAGHLPWLERPARIAAPLRRFLTDP
jgi:proline iminopeptidase